MQDPRALKLVLSLTAISVVSLCRLNPPHSEDMGFADARLGRNEGGEAEHLANKKIGRGPCVMGKATNLYLLKLINGGLDC